MTSTTGWGTDRPESLVLKVYLVLGGFVCVLTGLLVALGKAPHGVEDRPLAALLYLGGCLCFVLGWRRWADGGPLSAAQVFFATSIPYLSAGVAVGSPSGDTRVPLVLMVMLLAAVLLRVGKQPTPGMVERPIKVN